MDRRRERVKARLEAEGLSDETLVEAAVVRPVRVTDSSLRLYGYSRGPRALEQTWSRGDVLAVEGPTQVTTGSHEAHRVAVHLPEGGLLLVDSGTDADAGRLSGIAGTLRRALER